jgi:D-serine deaminase-like pyridoxal phosphate-dependent protein
MLIDWRAKGFWQPDAPVEAADFIAARHTLDDGSFTWPLLVLRHEAVRANIATMAALCERHGFLFAPHAKTSMAPALLRAQLEAGAWAMTVATASQALVLRRLGVPRVLIANEVLDPGALRWLAAQRDWEVYLQVDSVTGADRAAGLPLLVELGVPGGRTGCRTVDEVVTVARAAGDRLAGITGYEGGITDEAAVDQWLATLKRAAVRLAEQGLLPAEVIVSAGGSAWFDRVVEALEGQWLPGHTVRAVLRSGASVTHDDGFYAERTPFNREPREGGLSAALELHAHFDEGLPIARTSGVTVTRMNDHHTYLALADGVQVGVGEVLRFGISHPCTAFDKWRLLPVVDEAGVVVDVLETYF